MKERFVQVQMDPMTSSLLCLDFFKQSRYLALLLYRPLFALQLLVHSVFSPFDFVSSIDFVSFLITMLPLITFIILAYFLLYAFAYSIPFHLAPSQAPLREEIHLEKPEYGPQSSLEAWIREEEKIALDRLLRNIAPGGSNCPNCAPGTVIASPSKQHPNYYYQWIRDAATITHSLVDLYASNPNSYLSSHLIPILESYASLSHRLQHTPNPSGDFSDLSGLGEPKFHADGSAFTDSWGRPQRDGPALRALTLMAYLKAYNASHPALWNAPDGQNPFADLFSPSMPADSVIKADLEYVSHVWREEGFDLWEEVNGLHFFTAIVQLRALKEGAELAGRFGDYGAMRWYGDQTGMMEDFIERFWDDQRGRIVATLESKRSGFDCGVLLGAIHGTDGEDSEARFSPWSDEVLVSLLGLVKDQKQRFPINAAPSDTYSVDGGLDELAGVGIGRYPEDEYDGYGVTPAGGNPWFLCTTSASEVLYRTASHIASTRILNVTSTGLRFWSALLPTSDIKAGQIYNAQDPTYIKALQRLKTAGDSFLAVVRKHADGEGALSEQFDRVTGYERGALDLTWSYSAFMQAVRARQMLAVEERYR